MGADVVDLVTRFIDDRYTAPAADYSDLEPLLAALSKPPPSAGAGLRGAARTDRDGGREGLRPREPRLRRVHPRWRAVRGCTGRLPGVRRQPLHGGRAACSRTGPARGERAALAVRPVPDAAPIAGRADSGRLDGQPLRTRHCAHRATRGAFLDGTMYVSQEVHHSVAKSARFAGFPRRAVRVIGTDDALRMDPTCCGRRTARTARRAAGRFWWWQRRHLQHRRSRPAERPRRRGGRGGPVVPRRRRVRRVLPADRPRPRGARTGSSGPTRSRWTRTRGCSCPYGTGCLLARDATDLRAAHEERAHYLPPASQDDALPDFSSFSPELTRDFRGLRLWLPLHLHGVDAFVQALDEKLDLAAGLTALDRGARARRAVVAAAVAGRVQATRGQRPGDRGAAAPHQRQQPGLALLGCGRGQTFLRMCILSHRSRPGRIEEALEIIAAAAAD